MPRMAALKKACNDVVGRLSLKGCVGIVVVFPSDNSVCLVPDGDGANSVVSPKSRYIAAAAPSSMAEACADLCLENLVMRSSRDHKVEIFDVKAVGLFGLLSHNAKSITATSLPLVGKMFYATAYFMFRSVEPHVVQSLLREVSFETNSIWSALRASTREDFYENLKIDPSTVPMLGLAQSGFTSKEIADLVGLSSRVIEKKMDKFIRQVSSSNKLDAIQKAHLFGIL